MPITPLAIAAHPALRFDCNAIESGGVATVDTPGYRADTSVQRQRM